MKILALEFSSRQRSVAITDSEQLLARVETDEFRQSPLTLIDRALTEACLPRDSITTIALGIGPGSYTGIRGAIATAQGWQLARNVNLLAIPSTEILATTARANGLRGETDFIIDAQRHEYYHATWNLTDDSQTETSPLKIIGVTEAAELESHGPDPIGFSTCEPLYPDAAILARLATSRTNFQLGESIQPIYLRNTEFTKAPPPRQID